MNLSKNEKIKILTAELQQLNTNFDIPIDQNDIMIFLDKKVGDTFDRNVVEQLLERMDKDYQGKVTIKEFINIWCLADEILIQKIQQNQQKINDYKKDKIFYQQKLQKAQQTQKMNSNGIMEGSLFTIEIQKAQLKSTGSLFQLVLQLKDQNYSTTQQAGPSPVWTDQYSFQIEDGSEQLKISLENSLYQKVGLITINLDDLKDQQSHKETLNFSSNQGSLDVTMQWVFDKVKLYQNFLQKEDKENKIYQQDLEEYRKDYDTLYLPFPSLKTNFSKIANINAAQQNSNSQIQPQIDYQPQSQKKYLLIRHKLLQYDQFFFTRMMILLILLFSLLACFTKASFIDILYCSFYFTYWFDQKIVQQNIKYFVFVLFLTIILDIVWLSFNNDVLSIDQQSDTLLGFSWVMALLALIVKFIAEIGFIFLYRKLGSNQVIPV